MISVLSRMIGQIRCMISALSCMIGLLSCMIGQILCMISVLFRMISQIPCMISVLCVHDQKRCRELYFLSCECYYFFLEREWNGMKNYTLLPFYDFTKLHRIPLLIITQFLVFVIWFIGVLLVFIALPLSFIALLVALKSRKGEFDGFISTRLKNIFFD